MNRTLATLLVALVATGALAEDDGPVFEFWVETKLHVRSSEEQRIPVPFAFDPADLPPGQNQAFLETVNAGTHAEASMVTLGLDAVWSPTIAARLKLDLVQLYDRNPTSTDDEWDLDEAWVRFGRDAEAAEMVDRGGLYLKLGKMAKPERQNDRHLESYGLVSTAFNRFEDIGVEAGAFLGRHVYLVGSATIGNPVFMRDPNALAGDNGTPATLGPEPAADPRYKSGILILYDADVDDLDVDEPELGLGMGIRGESAGGTAWDVLVTAYRRELLDTVELRNTEYGGDLDLLLGPFNLFPLPVTDDDKLEIAATVWLYRGGFSLFLQGVDQDLGGLPRIGIEGELAWFADLPLRWSARGRQFFPWVQPAIRYSRLDNDFDNFEDGTPAPSLSWDWQKLDVGVRLGVWDQIDLTAEYAFNEFETAGGTKTNDELLVTLRWLFQR